MSTYGHRKNQSPEQQVAFGRRLDRAAFWEAYVSARLAREGFWVLHSPIVQSEDFDLNTVDLKVVSKDPTLNVPQRVTELEVKGFMEHPKDDNVFVCSLASFRRKYGKHCNALPVVYVMVDGKGDMRYLPRGTDVLPMQHWDIGRNEIFTAMKAKSQAVRPIADLIPWLRWSADAKKE